VRELTSLDKARIVAKSASAKKGENIVLMDMRGVSSLCDWFMIASASSTRRINTIFKAIQDELSVYKIKPLHREGRDNPYWAVLDYGDLVIHLFRTHVREFYGLERLWSDAPRTHIDEKWLRKMSR